PFRSTLLRQGKAGGSPFLLRSMTRKPADPLDLPQVSSRWCNVFDHELRSGPMPLHDHQLRALFEQLESLGWRWEDDTLMAPHRSFWLMREHPWTGDLDDFRERM